MLLVDCSRSASRSSSADHGVAARPRARSTTPGRTRAQGRRHPASPRSASLRDLRRRFSPDALRAASSISLGGPRDLRADLRDPGGVDRRHPGRRRAQVSIDRVPAEPARGGRPDGRLRSCCLLLRSFIAALDRRLPGSYAHCRAHGRRRRSTRSLPGYVALVMAKVYSDVSFTMPRCRCVPRCTSLRFRYAPVRTASTMAIRA